MALKREAVPTLPLALDADERSFIFIYFHFLIAQILRQRECFLKYFSKSLYYVWYHHGDVFLGIDFL